jgi:hypothetical protein
MLFSKGIYEQTAWHKAAISGDIEVLERLWNWAKELQLKPEELRNELLFSKGRFGKMPWREAAGNDNIKVLDKLWDWAIELQLKPDEIRKELSKKTVWTNALARSSRKWQCFLIRESVELS